MSDKVRKKPQSEKKPKNHGLAILILLIFLGFLFIMFEYVPELRETLQPVIQTSLFAIMGIILDFFGFFSIFVILMNRRRKSG